MNRYRTGQFFQAVRDQLTGRFSDAEARVLCYLMGPLSGAAMLHWRNHGHAWSVRFHAFHSIIMTGFWAASWGTLRAAEAISPWFLGAVARQLRFAMNLGFIVVWAFLVFTAYRGSRLAIVPFLHGLAVRLARKYEKHFPMETAVALR